MTQPPSSATTPCRNNSEDDLPFHRKVRNWLSRNQVVLLVIAGVATLLLGYMGFVRELPQTQPPGTPLDAFYLAIQLFSIRSGSQFFDPVWEVNVARFSAVLLVTFTTILIFSSLFGDKVRLFLLRTRTFFGPRFYRLVRSRKRRPGHIIVCGGGFLGSEIACQYRKEKRAVILLEKERDTSEIKACRENGVLVLHEDATNAAVLRRVCVRDAAMVFALTGDDGRNTDIASTCVKLTQHRQRGLSPLACHVHIDDANLSVALRQWELEIPNHDRIHVGFFNLYNSAGRSASACEATRVEKKAASMTGQPVLLIVGLGDFGQSLLVNLAMRWREMQMEPARKLTIIVVDTKKRAEPIVASLRARHPSLDDYCDLVPKPMDVRSAEFIRGDFLEGTDPHQLVGAYICLRSEADATSVAITLHDALCDRCGWSRSGATTPRILVRTINEVGMTEVVQKLHDNVKWNIHAFPILTKFCEERRYGNELADLLAEGTHQDYFEGQRALGKTAADNPNIVEWIKLPEDIKDTNRDQVESLIRNVHEFGYRAIPMRSWDEDWDSFDYDEEKIDEKDGPMVLALAEKEHERWMKMKVENGWKYGPERDDDRKIHPSLVPWNKLSPEEKKKDIDTVLGLPDRLARVYYRLERDPPGDQENGAGQGSG